MNVKLKRVSFFRHYLLVAITLTVLFLFLGVAVSGAIVGGGPEKEAEQLAFLNSLENKTLGPEEIKALHYKLMEPRRHVPLIFSILAAMLVASTLASSGAMLYFLRRKAKLAEEIMQDLERGKLDSRFPKDRFDEVTQFTGHFNKMADKVEGLVLKLRDTDESRKNLVQEISHDLKTPLASLMLSLDTLNRRKDLDAEKQALHLEEARHETQYIALLLEDLLFLSVVEDPAFRVHASKCTLNAVIQEILPLAQKKFPSIKCEIVEKGNFEIEADLTLIKRALRNVIENSISFSKNTLVINIHSSSLEILDDGPGMKESILAEYGKKRLNTERLSDEEGQRKSTGLGAVIANRILSLHGLNLVASNVVADGGSIAGAKVTIR